MANQLGSDVRLVTLQFSFTNPDVIPPAVRRLAKETPEERVVRKGRSSGVQFIAPTENCSLKEFLGELEAAGYELVDALYKPRIDERTKRTYHMVRFTFARSECAELSEEFGKVRETVRAELGRVCELAMWRVRVYRNPFFKNGEEVPEVYAMSVNLEARKPLFLPDGQPVTVWQKDGAGNRVGTAPLPIRADHCLRIDGGAVSLVT